MKPNSFLAGKAARRFLPSGALVCACLILGSWTCPSAGSDAAWGRVLIIGDEAQPKDTSVHVAEVYNPNTNQFELQPRMKHGRTAACATVIAIGKHRGDVLVAGGFEEGAGPLNSTELFDPSTVSFSDGPRLNDDRTDCTAVTIPVGPRAHWIIVSDSYTSDLYDPYSNQFFAGPELAEGHRDQTAVIIGAGPNAGKLLIAGGVFETNVATQQIAYSAATDLYDPVRNRFDRGPSMNVGRELHTATLISYGPNAGKILLIGGSGRKFEGKKPGDLSDDFATKSLDSTELYDPRTNTFAKPNQTAVMDSPRLLHTATIITKGPNAGKILVAGGERDDDTQLASTEIYDPWTNRFIRGPEMHFRRAAHVAVSILSGPMAGKVLIAGGVGGPTCRSKCRSILLTATEFYDPSTNAFIAGPPMHGAPGQVSAIQLPSNPFARPLRK